MKTFYLCLLMTLVLISCDSNIDDQITQESKTSENPVYKTGVEYHVSTSNPYDSAGVIHDMIAESYIGGTQSAPRLLLAAKLDSIAFSTPGFISLDGNYISLDTLSINAIMLDPELKLQQLLANSSLSNQARLQAESFIDGILNQLTLSKDEVILNNYISGYEATVVNLPNTQDKESLLILSALTRHALQFAKKPKRKPRDKDWDISVACLVAGMSGSFNNPQNAIMNLLYTEILTNE